MKSHHCVIVYDEHATTKRERGGDDTTKSEYVWDMDTRERIKFTIDWKPCQSCVLFTFGGLGKEMAAIFSATIPFCMSTFDNFGDCDKARRDEKR